MPLTLHAAWLRSDAPYPDGQLFFWAENTDVLPSTDRKPAGSAGGASPERNGRVRTAKPPSHPFQASVGQVRALLLELAPSLSSATLQLVSTTAWLPSVDGEPLARRNVLQHSVVNGADGAGPVAVAHAEPTLSQWQLTGIQLDALTALTVLTHLDQQTSGRTVQAPGSWRRLRLGNDLLFWSNAAKVALEILVGQHYLPGIQGDNMGRFHGAWQMALFDARIERQVAQLLRIMPPVCRAYDLADWRDAPSAEALGEHFLSTLVDVASRTWGHAAVPGRADSPSAMWMYNLLTEHRQVMLGPQAAYDFYGEWRSWTDQLRVSGDANFRICFVLYEPEELTGAADGHSVNGRKDDIHSENGHSENGHSENGHSENGHSENGRAERLWRLRYYLQARDNPALLVPAREVWATQDNALRIGERRLDRPQDRLRTGLGIAGRLFAPIERSLRSPQPQEALMETGEAYTFLRDIGPLLEASGFGVMLPDWWRNNQRARLGLHLRMHSAAFDDDDVNGDRRMADLDVQYSWLLTLGGAPLSREEFDALVAKKTPLVNLRGRWIELDPAQVNAATEFLNRSRTDGSMSFLQSLRMAQAYLDAAGKGTEAEPADLLDDVQTRDSFELLKDVPAQLPLEKVDVEGWLEQALMRLRQQDLPQEIAEPDGFIGSLRPYQQRGVGWLSYLRNLTIGACLADDMGLGKTIQAIALLLHVRAEAAKRNGNGAHVAPALLICPTSVVANWNHEIDRFAPSLRALPHHGVNRLTGAAFCKALERYDLVITSYGTARRDIDMLGQVEWSDLILDEAQNIKNPRAKQTQAVRSLRAANRIALTGTPVENQLAELWSIIEYLNPGYLGGFEHFRKEYVIPIERYNDDDRAVELRRMVQPFLLRRLKSDPTIISDLPEKNEMVVYCGLTKEQAELYETTVQETLEKLNISSGIQRRGMVLGLVTKLKQITNHPAHYLREDAPLARRSGKLDRLTEMLEEALSVGDRALVFTQFVEMGHLLQRHMTKVLETDVLFLHGGTTAKQRDEMVQLFQSDKGPPIFVLSLRAGGSGLNLTQANHVFHFDRWWNPAVEDQATDRAFRIGQTRNVQVHKFVVAGTLEERINQMIESKQALAEAIVGSGEDWLTELDNDQLRDLLMLRRESL